VPKHFAGVIKHASHEKRCRSGSISSVAEEGLLNAQRVQASNRQEAADRPFSARAPRAS
jgi:ATP-binding cassette subfamily B protein